MVSERTKRWVANGTSCVIDYDAARASRERQADRFLQKAHRAEQRKKKKKSQPKKKSSSNSFYASREWHRVRYKALLRSDGRCECCGAGKKDGVVLNVDHIKPLHKYPDLALKLSNLQVLCAICNSGKGGWDETDWREGRGKVVNCV